LAQRTIARLRKYRKARNPGRHGNRGPDVGGPREYGGVGGAVSVRGARQVGWRLYA
jgi:hypothetical protein